MSRTFVLLAHEAPVDPDFSLDDLPGGGGRLDLLARAVGSTLLVSHGIREDVTTHLVIRNRYVVRFEGADLRGLHPDERSTAARIRAALETAQEAVGAAEIRHAPGVYVMKGDLESVLAETDGPVVQLVEDGRPAADGPPPEDPVFVLSDHRQFTDREAELLASADAERVRLGPVAIHANDAVAVAHNWLDTRGYCDY
ncbi:MAG: tRNA (pseudouridine(54)-N(1))-methyltransferase TrmY [Haloarculaceae archaeon]